MNVKEFPSCEMQFFLFKTSATCSNAKHKVGNYSVDTSSLDKFLQPIYECRSATDILVIDEIGKMELKSAIFTDFISETIDSSRMDKFSFKVVIATVLIVKSIPIVETIKSLPNSKLFTVTKLNRNGIFDEIKATVTRLMCDNTSDELHTSSTTV